MKKLEITRDNWKGMIKFAINRVRADSALLQAVLSVYIAWTVGDWSLDGSYDILGLEISKKVLLLLLPVGFCLYVYYDLTRIWLAEQKFNASNHPFQSEFDFIRKELAEIKKQLADKPQEHKIRAYWQEPSGC